MGGEQLRPLQASVDNRRESEKEAKGCRELQAPEAAGQGQKGGGGMGQEVRGSVVLKETTVHGHLLAQPPPPSLCFGVKCLAFTFLSHLQSGRAGRKISVKKDHEDHSL